MLGGVGQFFRHVLVRIILFWVAAGIILKIADVYRPGTADEVFAYGNVYLEWVQRVKPGVIDWLSSHVGPLAEKLFVVFLYPAILLQRGIESLIEMPLIREDYPKAVLAGWLFVDCFFSWAVWSTAYVRGMRFFGLWNPFWNVEGRKRGLVLRGWLRFRDWWEMVQHFGRGPIAKWASLAEVLSHRFCGGDVFLGRPKLFIGGMMRPVGIATEKHMVTIAGTGSGKSTAALIPNLCLHEGSLLCIDPKGELAAITADRRGHGFLSRGMDQKVWVLDPFKIVNVQSELLDWGSYNPFDEIARVSESDPDRAVSYAATIAAALVRPMSEKESYWDEAAKTFIRGLVLYIFVHETTKNLVRLRQLIMEGDVEGWREGIALGVITAEGTSPFDFLIDRMKFSREGLHGEVIAACAGMLGTMGANQRGSVISTAQEHTAFLDLPEIRKVCQKSDFLLEDLKWRLVSVYVCVPVNMVAGPVGRWLRMFVLLFIDMMMRIQQAPNPPVLLAIDEFPSLGRLDGIETVAPMLRSYGVRFWAIGQDIAQFKNVYPDVWTGFIGGAEAVQFMGLIHPATVDFIVERLGEHQVMQGGRVVGVKPLLDRDQIGRFLAKNHKNQIVWFGSKRPMKLKVCPYYEYLPWWYYTPDPRFWEKPNRAIWRFVWRGWWHKIVAMAKESNDWETLEKIMDFGRRVEDFLFGWWADLKDWRDRGFKRVKKQRWQK